MLIKLDLEKAYDKVRWDFLTQTLQDFHFPEKLVNLIMSCVESAHLQILWNGEPLEPFAPRCGLRQGDPLSPYLFVLCMERLSYLIEEKVNNKVWDPISFGRNGPCISHMFFADDIILAAKANEKSARSIQKTLDFFCKASGLKVSLAKSTVYFAPRTAPSVRGDMVEILNFQPTSHLGKYLGVNINHSRNSSSNFRGLIEKVQLKLSGWKAKNLNLAARTTLIQSVTSALPTYSMHTNWLPTNICDKLDKLNRTFLWGASENVKKIHLVGWDKIIHNKSNGGLGLRESRKANMAMLAKTGWRIFQKDESTCDEDTQTFIVRVQNDLKPSAFSDVEQWYKATLRSLSSTPFNSENLQNSHDFLHVYKTVFHGFSAKLTPQQAQQLMKRPGVIAVLPDRLRQLHITRSPFFLGLSSTNPAGLLSESDSGSNVVIGIFDTGIWPERRSFHDEGLGPVPSNWKGECVEGEQFTKAHCNKKIIGARYFAAGYEARKGVINSSVELKSPRDSDGHGTHTASTAAGRAVSNASLFGYAKGVAIGVAPKARIAVYKICWKNGCMDSDILSAFDKAVEDGVNVISISVGGGAVPYNLDPIAIGSFGAMERGILVSASAGNEGPTKMTVTNVAPWLTTVGASTIDRRFLADLVLEDGRVINGASLYSGKPLPEKTYLPLIYGGNASASLTIGGRRAGSFSAATCMADSLDEKLVRGKIVVCDRGGNARVAKGDVVRKAGGVGVVVANVAPIGEGLVADSHLIPGLAITESAGHTIREYMNSISNPRATMVFRGTVVGVKPAPVVASFSSRGPSVDSPYVLKPDVIAPGVNILAAWPDGVAPSELASDPRRTEFNVASGTSMSCPHVSGVAALLKGAHADWSPAMIRSAMMTTAYSQDSDGKPLLDEKSYNVSTIWDMGAGHVNPEKAVNPGLVYDITTDDYLNFLCASNFTRRDIRQIARRSVNCSKKHLKPWDLNYPAISVDFEATSEPSDLEIVVTRTVTHVSENAASYEVIVTDPKRATAIVNPKKMEFTKKGERKSYSVRIKAEKLAVTPGNTVTEVGKIAWSDGRRQVVSPVVVVWKQGF
ncbi:hypothetical protein BUALT_Bualt02G0238000 [Buddleja alternifolia]|uniref:Reverse transcriptase domain-containing protein n=1 Tax=Buddleja alternifolia TaxID=168488 RepID=A0AAV6Y9K0_9LAMI|nr:hypothetical protein BUALT_Bualt02G0238000 [Buddleja alternifolia]